MTFLNLLFVFQIRYFEGEMRIKFVGLAYISESNCVYLSGGLILTHLKLWIAVAIYDFKGVEI